jgi:hypothetical protein
VLGEVAHRLKMIPAGHYNKLEAAGADGVRFAKFHPLTVGNTHSTRGVLLVAKRRFALTAFAKPPRSVGPRPFTVTHFAAHAASTMDL